MSLDWRRIYGKTVVGFAPTVALVAVAGSLVLLSAPQGARSAPPTHEERADAIEVAQTSK